MSFFNEIRKRVKPGVVPIMAEMNGATWESFKREYPNLRNLPEDRIGGIHVQVTQVLADGLVFLHYSDGSIQEIRVPV